MIKVCKMINGYGHGAGFGYKNGRGAGNGFGYKDGSGNGEGYGGLLND